MTRGVGGNSPANIQKHLEGVEYPATKQDLLTAARDNDAPREVVDTIEKLPQDRFAGPQEVMKAYGQLE